MCDARISDSMYGFCTRLYGIRLRLYENRTYIINNRIKITLPVVILWTGRDGLDGQNKKLIIYFLGKAGLAFNCSWVYLGRWSRDGHDSEP